MSGKLTMWLCYLSTRSHSHHPKVYIIHLLLYFQTSGRCKTMTTTRMMDATAANKIDVTK